MKNNLATINLPLLFLIGFAILSVGFGWWKIRHNIFSPFTGLKMVATTISPEEQLRILTQDTDKDGLPDIQEQSIGTSAYLADSDSDGFSDKEEVVVDSSPLNPNSTPQNKGGSKEPVVLEEVVGVATVGPEETGIIPRGKILSEPSPSEIRKILVEQAGLSPEIVDKVDDETLIKLYNETKAELGVGLREIAGSDLDFSKLISPLSTGGSDKDFFNLLTGSQIRELLIEAGADKKMLEGINDETLKTLFLEAIETK